MPAKISQRMLFLWRGAGMLAPLSSPRNGGRQPHPHRGARARERVTGAGLAMGLRPVGPGAVPRWARVRETFRAGGRTPLSRACPAVVLMVVDLGARAWPLDSDGVLPASPLKVGMIGSITACKRNAGAVPQKYGPITSAMKGALIMYGDFATVRWKSGRWWRWGVWGVLLANFLNDVSEDEQPWKSQGGIV